MRLHKRLYFVGLRSGNDSAAALAIHHSGSIEKFAEVMNARASLFCRCIVENVVAATIDMQSKHKKDLRIVGNFVN